jgi:hypothetical protein
MLVTRSLAPSSGALHSIRIGIGIRRRLLSPSRISGVQVRQRRCFTAWFRPPKAQLVGKVFTFLHSYMANLEYVMEPLHNCPVDDSKHKAFVHATTTIGGRDAIEEFMAS